MSKRTAAQQLRSAAAMLDALDVGVLALDGRNRLLLANSIARDLLGLEVEGSSGSPGVSGGSGAAPGAPGAELPRPLLDLVDEVWRGEERHTRDLVLGQAVLRLRARRVDDAMLVLLHDITLLRHLQRAHSELVAAITDALLERVEGPALLVEALATVDDPVLATRWLRRLRGDVAGLADLLGHAPGSPAPPGPSPPAASSGVGGNGEAPASGERLAPRGPGAAGARRGRAGNGGDRPTLLLVEPVGVLADALTVGLSHAGFDTVVAPDARTALEVVEVAEPDCVIVDTAHAGIDHTAARRLREATAAPMLLLSGRDAEPAAPGDEAIPGTVAMARPLRLRELVAEVHGALVAATPAPAGGDPDGLLSAGDVVLDSGAHTVWVRGRRVPMSTRELQLLRVLLVHAGQVLPHERLLELAWGSDANGATLGAYVRKLRRKIERDPAHPEHLITLKGIGVRFDVPRSGAPTP